ncbi:MAG: transposase [Polyangiaceae bacterium]|nr:transposase [Polyangiaceae bacterium]
MTRFARAGVDVASQTLGRGVHATIDLLEPIAKQIEECTRGPGVLGTDASAIPILDPEMEAGIRTGAMWVWTNARWVSFLYSPSGDSDSVRCFLKGDLARTVQCDGTSVTSFIERSGGTRPGCWSHGRRRFVEAARAGDRIALEALQLIAPIFGVERESMMAGDCSSARRARRVEKTRLCSTLCVSGSTASSVELRRRPRSARLWDTSTANGSGSCSSSRTATSRRRTIDVSASSGASSWEGRTGSSPGATTEVIAPRESSRSSRPRSRTT